MKPFLIISKTLASQSFFGMLFPGLKCAMLIFLSGLSNIYRMFSDLIFRAKKFLRLVKNITLTILGLGIPLQGFLPLIWARSLKMLSIFILNLLVIRS